MSVPFDHAGQLSPADELDHRPLSDWAIEYETARGGVDEAFVLRQAGTILDIMRRGIRTGLAGTEYDDRILGWQSGRFTELAAAGRLLDGGLLNRMIGYVTALMEAKSAMEVIVAAPTAGSCATFPGALVATIDDLAADGERANRALLTGGLIGVFVANRSSFAAEVGGCQAETGAGAAMAAAALVELAGGSAAQSLSAASQALQNVLGLVCDPIGNRVEAPCLGRNVVGAANALSCANMALAGYDHLVPLDEVLDAHRSISESMPRELRCTGLGGLAVTPTAQRIELGLKRQP
jgi:L-serine dehydratase